MKKDRQRTTRGQGNMKIIHLFRLNILAFLCISTWAFAADEPGLSLSVQEEVQQMTQEMSALGIPEAKAQKMLTLMHQNRFQHLNIVRAQQTVMNAAKEGIPTEPIMNKALEGMVKRAQQQQVIVAMEKVRNRHQYAHRTAKSLAKDKKTADSVAEAVSDSLAAGMTTGDMDRIMAQLHIQNRQQTNNQAEELSLQTMQTVRTMARLGATNTAVTEVVNQALQHQYTSRQMQQMRNKFARDAQQTSASQLAHQYAGSISNGDSPGNSNGGGNSSSGGGSGNGADSGGGNGGSGGNGGNGGGNGGRS